MESDPKPAHTPSVQDAARRMLQKLESEAASDPNSMLAEHIAMNKELEEAAEEWGVGEESDAEEE